MLFESSDSELVGVARHGNMLSGNVSRTEALARMTSLHKKVQDSLEDDRNENINLLSK